MKSTNQGSVVYVDEKGFHVYVSDGIAGGAYFFTVRKDPLGRKGEKRICSPALPHRKTIGEAEADLAVYAGKKGWKPKGQEDKLVALDGQSIQKKPKPPAYVSKGQLGLM